MSATYVGLWPVISGGSELRCIACGEKRYLSPAKMRESHMAALDALDEFDELHRHADLTESRERVMAMERRRMTQKVNGTE